MTIATYTAGWAVLGFGVRLYQLGLQRRNLFESAQTLPEPMVHLRPLESSPDGQFPTDLGGHLLSTAVFGGAGFYFYGLKPFTIDCLFPHPN